MFLRTCVCLFSFREIDGCLEVGGSSVGGRGRKGGGLGGSCVHIASVSICDILCENREGTDRGQGRGEIRGGGGCMLVRGVVGQRGESEM